MEIKQIIKDLNRGITIWFWISLMFWIFWISYALLSDLKVDSWETLKAADWNNLVDSAVPTWAVMAFNGTVCPEWWTAADWSGDEKDTEGNLTTLDLRNEFIRWTSDTRTLRNKENWTVVGAVAEVWVSNDIYFWADQAWVPTTDYDEQVSIWTARDWRLQVTWVYHSAYERLTSVRVRPTNVALLYCVKN